MLKALEDVLKGQEENHLLPFYWQHGNHTGKIPEQIERIRQSGARALCVESRPHPDFCGPDWWRDMDVILSECRRRDMQVWLLDDSHFPTGGANGEVRKHPELHRSQLVYQTVDVMGPASCVQLRLPQLDPDETLLRAVAFRRTDAQYDPAGNFTDGEQVTGAPSDLTGNIRGNWLFWDVPEGCWRVFFLIVSPRRGVQKGQEWYVDLLNPDSCRLLIDAVYEPHFARYSELFGTTFMGFFSDEPGWYNCFDKLTTHTVDHGGYYYKVGMPGLGLPWSDRLLPDLTGALGQDPVLWLPLLWFRDGDRAPQVRFAYMDAVTRAYEENFTRQLGGWCRAHNVSYIGHIIEDHNAGGRLGYGAGHYFRALHGQDMAGIDIVLHQVMPGMAHYDAAYHCWSANNARFFHYVLGKLGGSMAHLDPLAKGRGMCEVFGAYGWSEGVPAMKWLIDYLLVRGINWFVPHAFSPEFPDPDCPPHMGADGRDPQFGAFRELMAYTNRAAHLLSGGVHQAPAALLYHAEAEWMNYSCMLVEEPACALYDRQIDYDIVCADMLEEARAEDGRLCVGPERFDVLIVPQARLLPQKLVSRLGVLAEQGVRVWFVNAEPENADGIGEAVPLADLAERCGRFSPVRADRPFDFLRVYHYIRDGADLYMLFNESVTETCELRLTLPSRGGYLSLDLLNGGQYRGWSDGGVPVRLRPYESRILAFGAVSDAELAAFPEPPACTVRTPLDAEWTIERASWETPGRFEPCQKTRVLPNLTGPDGDPDFSGFVRYSASFDAGDCPPVVLDLGQVGQTVRMTLNGVDLGWRVAPPYSFDVSAAARPGENRVELLVANTLGNALRDPLSFYMPVPPTGLLGPVELVR